MNEHKEDRVAIAGACWEMGMPLTDDVLATRQYLLATYGTTDVPVPSIGREKWNIDFEYSEEGDRLIATPRKVDA